MHQSWWLATSPRGHCQTRKRGPPRSSAPESIHFYTLLRHRADGTAHDKLPLDDLLTVWGFDVPLRAPEAFTRLSASIAEVAAITGRPRSRSQPTCGVGLERGQLGANRPGPQLSAVGLALEHRYRTVLIPSSIGYHSLKPRGTHPLTDPLLSTSRTEIRNDGALARRASKIEACRRTLHYGISMSAGWGDHRQIAVCEVCCTLTMFELLDARDRAVTFPARTWSLDAVAALRLRNALDREAMMRMMKHAKQYGRLKSPAPHGVPCDGTTCVGE